MTDRNPPVDMEFETVEPIGKRVLIRKDEDKKQTKGGIQLPDNIEIPTITGRIVAVSAEVETLPEIPPGQVRQGPVQSQGGHTRRLRGGQPALRGGGGECGGCLQKGLIFRVIGRLLS